MTFTHAQAYSRRRGFTVTELLIVLVILGLLAAFGLPAILKYSLQSRLVTAQNVLRQIARNQSQWLSDHGSYASLSQLGYPVDTSLAAIYLDKTGAISGNASRDSIYRVTLMLAASAVEPAANAKGPAAYYLVTAQPINDQAKDSGCGTLSLASTGQIGASGARGEADCWKK